MRSVGAKHAVTIGIVALQKLPFNSLWQAVVQLQQRQEADNHLHELSDKTCRCCNACQPVHRGLMDVNIQESNIGKAHSAATHNTPGQCPAAACCRLL